MPINDGLKYFVIGLVLQMNCYNTVTIKSGWYCFITFVNEKGENVCFILDEFAGSLIFKLTGFNYPS